MVIILRMYEVISGYFYLPKWEDPTSENTFYSSKNFALSDRVGLKKIQDGVFEQFKGQTPTNFVNLKKEIDIVTAT